MPRRGRMSNRFDPGPNAARPKKFQSLEMAQRRFSNRWNFFGPGKVCELEGRLRRGYDAPMPLTDWAHLSDEALLEAKIRSLGLTLDTSGLLPLVQQLDISSR